MGNPLESSAAPPARRGLDSVPRTRVKSDHKRRSRKFTPASPRERRLANCDKPPPDESSGPSDGDRDRRGALQTNLDGERDIVRQHTGQPTHSRPDLVGTAFRHVEDHDGTARQRPRAHAEPDPAPQGRRLAYTTDNDGSAVAPAIPCIREEQPEQEGAAVEGSDDQAVQKINRTALSCLMVSAVPSVLAGHISTVVSRCCARHVSTIGCSASSRGSTEGPGQERPRFGRARNRRRVATR